MTDAEQQPGEARRARPRVSDRPSSWYGPLPQDFPDRLRADGWQLEHVASTVAGACGADATSAGVLACPAARGWVVDQTDIPAGEAGTLFAEIHKANGDAFGFASVPQGVGDLPELDLASVGCTR
jgi:hypothetical protein